MEIKLTQGYFAIIDDEDYHLIKNHKWHVRISPKIKIKYATATVQLGNQKFKIISMHRVLLGLTDPQICVDHIDHDGLNNRRINLRTCSKKQNNQHRRPSPNSASKYLGVTIGGNKWQSTLAGKYLGRFKEEIDAAKAYDKAALEYYGEFAYLNFPIETTCFI